TRDDACASRIATGSRSAESSNPAWLDRGHSSRAERPRAARSEAVKCGTAGPDTGSSTSFFSSTTTTGSPFSDAGPLTDSGRSTSVSQLEAENQGDGAVLDGLSTPPRTGRTQFRNSPLSSVNRALPGARLRENLKPLAPGRKLPSP